MNTRLCRIFVVIAFWIRLDSVAVTLFADATPIRIAPADRVTSLMRLSDALGTRLILFSGGSHLMLYPDRSARRAPAFEFSSEDPVTSVLGAYFSGTGLPHRLDGDVLIVWPESLYEIVSQVLGSEIATDGFVPGLPATEAAEMLGEKVRVSNPEFHGQLLSCHIHNWYGKNLPEVLSPADSYASTNRALVQAVSGLLEMMELNTAFFNMGTEWYLALCPRVAEVPDVSTLAHRACMQDQYIRSFSGDRRLMDEVEYPLAYHAAYNQAALVKALRDANVMATTNTPADIKVLIWRSLTDNLTSEGIEYLLDSVHQMPESHRWKVAIHHMPEPGVLNGVFSNRIVELQKEYKGILETFLKRP